MWSKIKNSLWVMAANVHAEYGKSRGGEKTTTGSWPEIQDSQRKDARAHIVPFSKWRFDFTKN